MSSYDDAKSWLEAQLPKASLTSQEETAVRSLIGNEAFATLLSYLAAEVQGYYRQLTYLPADKEQRQISVIQGRIQGIESLRETLLSLYPTDPTSEGAQ